MIKEISCSSVIISGLVLKRPYAFVADANTFLAVLTSICLFLFFLNTQIKYSKTINTIASTTYGILLIHAHSDSMRQWLWKDIFDNVGTYNKSMMPLRAIGTVLIVFCVCSLIDLIRQFLIEKPFMKIVETKWLKTNSHA